MNFIFGQGNSSKTVTDYFQSTVFPALDFSLTEVIFIQLLKYLQTSGELVKFKETKEEIFLKERRERRRKERSAMGESITGSEEDWEEDSENPSEVEEDHKAPEFDPIYFIARKMKEYKLMHTV